MATSPIPVLTVDRLPLVHAGVRQLLQTFPDIKLVGEAYTIGEVPWLLAESLPVVVLVEIDDMGPEWAALLQRLIDSTPGLCVVVFSLRVTPERVRRALQLGVRGYLCKQVQPLALAQALRSIAAGQQVLGPEAAQAMMSATPDSASLVDALSQREREVLALLAKGLSNEAISARLCVSRATVKFHCGNLFGKLGVTTRSQAIAAAFAHNLVPRLVPPGDLTHLPASGAHREALLRRA